MTNERIKIWLQQVRAPFLLLSVVLVLIGIAVAAHDGTFHWLKSILLVVGVVFAHISVNLFNELSDYKTGIDEFTQRTAFSGGSGMLQKGNTTPQAVRLAAYSSLILSGLIGTFFCITSSWYILILMILGGVAIRFYTSHLARWLLGEIFSGLTLGSLVVLGTYLALTGYITVDAIFVSLPPGILTFLLLFLNEFPDTEADRKGGRYHLVIFFGKQTSAKIYISCLLLTYIFILIIPLFFNAPYKVLISFLTLPAAIKAGSIVYKYHGSNQKLLPAMGLNVAVVLLTDLLLAVGFFF